MEKITIMNFIIAAVFTVCYAYQFFYILIALVKKGKEHKETKLHRYAVLISARNEETVITQLIDSIKNQDYPPELVTIFVAADNCTDATAEKARAAGAIVRERSNKHFVGKGYALEFLLRRIHETYSGDRFDGYFIFDADNLLSVNYITEINKTFSDGYQIITSYRNSKNYGSNWISAGYALLFLREAKYLNNARMLLGTSCAVSGTGFMFSGELLKKIGGWKFFLLTEDIEFTVYNILNNEKIGYCGSAVIYDEQPTRFGQSWNQRMRWAKGYLQIYKKYSGKLLRGFVLNKSFSCFDMSMVIMPAIVLLVFVITVNLFALAIGFGTGENVWIILQSLFKILKNSYFMMLFIGGITTVTEWKQIHTTTIKKILYTFTFPLFVLTYIPISFVALFKKVEWKPIHHSEAKTLDDIDREEKE